MNIRFLLACLFLNGCVVGPSPEEKLSQWNEVCKNNFFIGATKERVIKHLIENDIEHSYVDVEQRIYAIDREVRNWRLIYSTAISVIIQFNEQETVVSCSAKTEYSGL